MRQICNQHGSNITADRLRFDFNHDKLTPEKKNRRSKIKLTLGLMVPVGFAVYQRSEALNMGAIGAFGER